MESQKCGSLNHENTHTHTLFQLKQTTCTRHVSSTPQPMHLQASLGTRIVDDISGGFLSVDVGAHYDKKRRRKVWSLLDSIRLQGRFLSHHRGGYLFIVVYEDLFRFPFTYPKTRSNWLEDFPNLIYKTGMATLCHPAANRQTTRFHCSYINRMLLQ